jgi:hypothetical protein
MEIEMRILKTAGLALGLLSLVAVQAPAQAAGAPASCAADLRQLCPNASGHALKQCRNAHHNNFSQACRQSLAANGMKLKDLKDR